MALVIVGVLAPTPAPTAGEADKQIIFPGQAPAAVSAGIIEAYHLALNRDYAAARDKCLELGRKYPNDPSGPTGEMVLYQVMMLENDDYEFDREFRDAAARAHERAGYYEDNAVMDDWYYTLLGAAYGIEGIYFLRRDEYMNGIYLGGKGLHFMQVAHDRRPDNWEANMGIGVYIYYRSAYSSFIPLPWIDQRQTGINMVIEAGKKRPYLYEVSRIALYYIYINEKDYGRALSYMDGLIKDRPDFPIFHMFRGRALAERGDWPGAYNAYHRMMEIDPKLYLPYFRLGECCLNQGKKDEAKKWFNEFFRVLGSRDSTHKKKALAYLEQLK